MNINDLPAELLCNIFLYGDHKDWVLVLPLVCHAWKNALELVWRKVQRLSYGGQTTHLTMVNGRAILVKGNKHLSANGNDVDNDAFCYLVNNCGETLKSLVMEVGRNAFGIKKETILSVGNVCKNLRVLDLYGDLASVGDSLSIACRGFSNLEEISVSHDLCDGSTDISLFVNNVLTECRKLRVVKYACFSVEPVNVDGFAGLIGLKLNEFCWHSDSPVPPSYVETILSTLARCNNELKKVRLNCEIIGPLNGSLCRDLITVLGKEKRIESLDLKFQLLLPKQTGSDYEWSKVAKASWTADIISPMIEFSNLHELTLQLFDFSVPAVSEALEKLAPRLTSLNLMYNYHLTDAFVFALTAKMSNLTKLVISGDDTLSHVCLTHFVAKCPHLTSFRVGCIDSVSSYQHLLMSLHEYLHTCGDNDKKLCTTPLTVSLVCYYAHWNFENVRTNVNLCGVKFVEHWPLECEISRVCCKSMASGSSSAQPALAPILEPVNVES